MNKTEDDELDNEELSDEEIRALSEGLCFCCMFVCLFVCLSLIKWIILILVVSKNLHLLYL